MIICPFQDLKRYLPLIDGLEEAMAAANAVTDFSGSSTMLSGGNRMNVMEIDTISVHGRPGEAHRKYMDIQYVVEGEEIMGWAPLEQLQLVGEFNEEGDIGRYDGQWEFIRIAAGNCYVVFPEDGHLPSGHLDTPCHVKKIVLKMKV